MTVRLGRTAPPAPDAVDAVHALSVDPVACDAYGYCAELLPELVGLDEWGYPVVDGEPVPAELVARAQEAARQCPRRAIRVLRRTPVAVQSGAPRR